MNANPNKFFAPSIFMACILLASSAFGIDLTFFAVSDTHYGQNSAAKDTNRAHMPAFLNALPGTTYPSTAGGGTVGTPRGVLLPGDLVELPLDSLWNIYTGDYGVNGEKKVHFPVYDGLGNHDQPGVSQVILPKFVTRSATRQNPVNFDSLGYNYSWDWDGVHFVHLNLYAGGTETGYFSSGTGGNGGNALNSRAFLQQDLAQRVGTSGRPVFIMQHYPMTDATYWTAANKQLLYSAIQGYNVIGILNGHSHAKTFYKWNGIDAYDDGTVMNGDILVFHITDNHLLALNRLTTISGSTITASWGTLKRDTTISMGTSSISHPDPNGYRRDGSFTVAGTGWIHNIPGNARFIEISDLRGHLIRRIPVQGARTHWDRLNAFGHRMPGGVYLFKITGTSRTTFGKAVLNP